MCRWVIIAGIGGTDGGPGLGNAPKGPADRGYGDVTRNAQMSARPRQAGRRTPMGSVVLMTLNHSLCGSRERDLNQINSRRRRQFHHGRGDFTCTSSLISGIKSALSGGHRRRHTHYAPAFCVRGKSRAGIGSYRAMGLQTGDANVSEGWSWASVILLARATIDCSSVISHAYRAYQSCNASFSDVPSDDTVPETNTRKDA